MNDSPPTRFGISAETSRQWSKPSLIERLKLGTKHKAVGQLELDALAFMNKQRLDTINNKISAINDQKNTLSEVDQINHLNDINTFLKDAYTELELLSQPDTTSKAINRILSRNNIEATLTPSKTITDLINAKNTNQFVERQLKKLGFYTGDTPPEFKEIIKSIASTITKHKETTKNLSLLANQIQATFIHNRESIEGAFNHNKTNKKIILNNNFVAKAKEYIFEFKKLSEKRNEEIINVIISKLKELKIL